MKNEMLANAREFFNAHPVGYSLNDPFTDNDKGKRKEADEFSIFVDRPDTQPPLTGGVPVKLWKIIMEEVYQRSVGPDVEDTKKYKSFSSETYGELNPMCVISGNFSSSLYISLLNDGFLLDLCLILSTALDLDPGRRLLISAVALGTVYYRLHCSECFMVPSRVIAH